MLDSMETLKELFLQSGKLKVWLEDPRVSGELRAKARAEGEAAAARQMLLTFLTRRFGELPEALVERVAAMDLDECQRLFDRAITAASLSELFDNP